MRKRRIAAALLPVLAAALLALWPGGIAKALPVAPDAGPTPPGFPAPEPGKGGQTAVGVQTSPANLGALSYEVPLYVTLAVVETETGSEVLVPSEDAYRIHNTSADQPGGGGESGIVVTSLEVEALGDWKLKHAPAQYQEMSLKIGGVMLPELDQKGDKKSVAVNDGNGTANSFFDGARYVELTGGNRTLNLPLEAVAGGHSGQEVSATAQFKLSYTISLLDVDGNPIGVFYDEPEPPDPDGANP